MKARRGLCASDVDVRVSVRFHAYAGKKGVLGRKKKRPRVLPLGNSAARGAYAIAPPRESAPRCGLDGVVERIPGILFDGGENEEGFLACQAGEFGDGVLDEVGQVIDVAQDDVDGIVVTSGDVVADLYLCDL